MLAEQRQTPPTLPATPFSNHGMRRKESCFGDPTKHAAPEQSLSPEAVGICHNPLSSRIN